MGARGNVLELIGNTPLVKLRRVVPPGCAEVFVKVESQNPTGSMKDRMAQSMITRAESDGRLKPGGSVVEYSSGSTGASLALVCGAKGYRLRIVTSDAFSRDKLTQMAAFGAELTIVPSEDGLITKALIQSLIAKAKEFSQEPGTYWTDQLNNADSIAGYHPLGEEIWEQTDGRVDAFVQSVGTSASLRGTASVLRRHNPGLRVVAVEPGSPRCCRAANPVHTSSRASESATRRRCGTPPSRTRSSRSRPLKPKTWPGAWPAKRDCSQEHQPARTSSRQSGSGSVSGRRQGSPLCWSIRA